MNHTRFLNNAMLSNLVVVTPVMAGVDALSMAVHVVPSYNRGLSAPFTQYKYDVLPMVTFMDSQMALVRPETTAAPTAPLLLTS